MIELSTRDIALAEWVASLYFCIDESYIPCTSTKGISNAVRSNIRSRLQKGVERNQAVAYISHTFWLMLKHPPTLHQTTKSYVCIPTSFRFNRTMKMKKKNTFRFSLQNIFFSLYIHHLISSAFLR